MRLSSIKSYIPQIKSIPTHWRRSTAGTWSWPTTSRPPPPSAWRKWRTEPPPPTFKLNCACVVHMDLRNNADFLFKYFTVCIYKKKVWLLFTYFNSVIFASIGLCTFRKQGIEKISKLSFWKTSLLWS